MLNFPRRQFITNASVGLCAAACPFSVFANTEKTRPQRTLILIELHGGNDGLNTVIPTQDELYYKLRPNIHIPRSEQLSLTNEVALHPALKPLMTMIDAHDVALIQGLGYENPNRSHFRSIEIWDTASNSKEYLADGWLTQLNLSADEKKITDAIVFGRNAAPVLAPDSSMIVIDSVERFYRQAKVIDNVDGQSQQSALRHLLKTQNATKAAAEQLKDKLSQHNLSLPEFGGGEFGQQLQEAAKLMLLGGTAPVIKVALGGFDTHQNQKVDQNQLLSELADGLASFYKVIKAAGLWDDVLLMTYSEFGRRVAENGSGGTDHGTAAPHFVLGGKVKGGVYGAQPSLSSLDNGDLKFTTHFKDYYQTVLTNWLGSSKVISTSTLPFVS